MSLKNHKTILLDFWKYNKITSIITLILLIWVTYVITLFPEVITNNISIGIILLVLILYTIDIWKALKNAAIVNKFSLYSSAKNTEEIIKLATLSKTSTNTYFLFGSLLLISIAINKLGVANFNRITYIATNYIYLIILLYAIQAKSYLTKYISLAVKDSIEDTKNKLFKGENNEEK